MQLDTATLLSKAILLWDATLLMQHNVEYRNDVFREKINNVRSSNMIVILHSML